MNLSELIDKSFIEPIIHERAYIGVEIELPLVPIGGGIVTTKFVCQLDDFVIGMGFSPAEYTDDGIVCRMSDAEGDMVSFDTSWNTLEFSLKPRRDVFSLQRSYYGLLIPMQHFCMERGFFVCGRGINPNYAKFDPAPMNSSMIKTYTRFLEKYTWHHDTEIFHALCASVQTHFDACDTESFLKMFSLFRKAYVFDALFFANSLPPDADFIENRPALRPLDRDTLCYRDELWKYSGAANTQLLNVKLDTLDDYRQYIRLLKLFVVGKDGGFEAIKPSSLDEYCSDPDWTEEMFALFRSFEPVAPTRRGTVEIRSVCSQPLDTMLTPSAFYTGLYAELDETAALVDEIYEKYFPALETPQIRVMLMKRSDSTLRPALRDEGRKLIELSIKGLRKRGYGEEKFLYSLLERLENNGWRVPAECTTADALDDTKHQMKNIEKECGINVN